VAHPQGGQRSECQHKSKRALFRRSGHKSLLELREVADGAIGSGRPEILAFSPQLGHASSRLRLLHEEWHLLCQSVGVEVYCLQLADMTTRAENLVSEIKSLPDEEKLKVLDALLTELDRRDSEVDQIWVREARKRWSAYKAGEVATVSYQELMDKYSR
jgi:hypothetical protein